jgi:hypothetical protein
VELSQQYIADVLGENWQDEYYVWDCAAGTGNLLAGLTNKGNLWASTIDQADVDVMMAVGRLSKKPFLYENHVFQFDFLNDPFLPKSKGGKVPNELFEIINDEKKRHKLVIYINPPYAEAASADRNGNKPGVSKNKTQETYKSMIGKAANELFALFLIRIYKEIQSCKIANFAKLKAICASNFADFRLIFKAKLEHLFICPAYTFDNVKGKFPIGFHIWDTAKEKRFKEITADVYDENGEFIGQKGFYSYENVKYINDWYRQFYDTNGHEIGVLNTRGNDFQNQNYIYISSENNFNHTSIITSKNLIHACIYITVRHCIDANWLNDRDQFLYPNDGWVKDLEFQSDCLAFTLFQGYNHISSKYAINHWIPFTEKEINACESFDSHFMLSFIGGKIIQNGYSDLFEQNTDTWCVKRKFSTEAKAVFDAGSKLWIYYHEQPRCKVNASLYDIREHFQGRDEKGKMNAKSDDETYNALIGKLREKLKVLAKKIEPKVYEYGFLKE